MKNPHNIDKPSLIEIIEIFGKEICKKHTDIIKPIVITTISESILVEYTLYIFAPEISYEYRILNFEVHQNTLKAYFFTLATKQVEIDTIDISNNTDLYINYLNKIKETNVLKSAIQLLVNQVQLRRDYKTEPIRDKIVIGQARVGVLNNNDKINVGWIRIENDEVIYYTGKGLREIWKPNMTEEERNKAEQLKSKTETELIKLNYIERRKINDFKDIV